MSRRILSLCFPTCNRKEKLIATVRTLLACSDNRFSITISDNVSTDDTVRELKEIKDDRLCVFSLDKKIPAYENYNQVIQFADANYVLHILDKECIDTEYLVDFIDFLEREKPNFGLVDIFGRNTTERFCKYSKGVSSILNGGGRGDTHPSGFYYRKDLYSLEYERIKPIIKDGNLWVLDIVSAGLGARYDSVVYYKPFITYNKSEILSGKTMSPYTDKTIYWYGGKRIDSLKLFIKTIITQNEIGRIEKEHILYSMLEGHLLNMVWTQVVFFQDKQRCNHYGIETRKIKAKESINWMNCMIKDFCKEVKYSIPLRFLKLSIIYVKGLRSIALLNRTK